jgi:2',3'-cyclic-nucleotide 2'-phosphodiesterase (5'-nucleotidase family)
MKEKFHFPVYWFVGFSLFLSLSACRTSYHPVSSQRLSYRVKDSLPGDPALKNLIAQYSDSVNETMNLVIGTVEKTLIKAEPEGTLGNIIADAFRVKATEWYKVPVDVAFQNPGGIRQNSIEAGKVTVGKVFEVLPFDNILVVSQVSGDVLQQLLDNMAASGGWPVSGMTMEIFNKKAVQVKIGGVSLAKEKKYWIALSDYLAGIGGGMTPLKNQEIINHGYLQRKAFIEYLYSFTHQGKPISAQIEKRVIHAE